MKFTPAIALVGFLSAALAHASRPFSPGEAIKLGGNEAIVVMGVDVDSEIESVEFDRRGSLLSFPDLRQLKRGTYIRVSKMTVGQYAYHKMKYNYIYWELDDLTNREFSVQAGRVNYIGTLRSRGVNYRTIAIENAALSAYQQWVREFPNESAKYPWLYSGQFPDPFVDELAAQASAAATQENNLNAAEILPSVVERDLAGVLFRGRSTEIYPLSPNGRFALEAVAEGATTVSLRILDRNASTPLRHQLQYLSLVFTSLSIDSARGLAHWVVRLPWSKPTLSA